MDYQPPQNSSSETTVSTDDRPDSPGDGQTVAESGRLSRSDLADIHTREEIPVRTDTAEHADFDHCAADIEGRVVVAVENEVGELLVLCNDEFGVALLPHGDVTSGEDYASVAREEVEAATGISIALDSIELLREVDHVVEPGGKPHTTTHRVILRAHPIGGEIQDCKQRHEAGSDDWMAQWGTQIPERFEVPDGGPGDDITYVFG